jgi:predicted phosphodiesterase
MDGRRWMKGTVLTWLHISDIHLRESTGWAQDIVLSRMLEDIITRYRSSPPDLVFVTGDVAFSGKAKEYQLAEDFLRKLSTQLGLELGNVFVVPGNHDIDRDLEEDAFRGARDHLTAMTDVDRFFASDGRRRTLFSRQREFRDFVNGWSPSPIYSDSSFCHYRLLKVGSVRVRVLLIDSTWLAAGGEDDAGKLLVGERQVLGFDQAASPDGDTISFALMHHPFSWLREFEQVVIENALIEQADLCLRGHVHVADQRATETLQGRIGIFTAGAAFETRTTENTYLWCSLDLATGGGRKVTHRYVHHDKRWEASEPQPWTLVAAPSTVSVETALPLVRGRCQYPHYVACLIAGLVSDVPIQVGSRAYFLSSTASVPGAPHVVGDLVARLRFHAHWKSVWDEAAWQAALDEMLATFDEQLRCFGPLSSEIARKEKDAAVLTEAVVPQGNVLGAVYEEIEQLLDTGDVARAREVVDRWSAEDSLSDAEKSELKRLNARVLLAENQPAAALTAVEALLSRQRAPRDLSLAAICAHRAGESSRAAKLMHEALDAGVNTSDVKKAALAIAGSSGDSALVRRVRP